MENKTLDLFAVVELFGHTKMAGRVTERTVGSAAFIQVDVPETDQQPSYSRLLNPSAIYAINPVTEEIAKHMAGQIQSKPIETWDARQMLEKLEQLSAKQLQEVAGYTDDLPY